MGDFLATPFLIIAQAALWLGSFINGRMYVLMEVSEDDLDEHNDGN